MTLRPFPRKRPAPRPDPLTDAPSPPPTAALMTPAPRAVQAAGGVSRWQDEADPDGSGERVPVVHRVGAVVVALVIGAFGVLGFAGGLDYFSTEGEQVLGLSSNGLLSTVSVVTAAVLIAAAFAGARIASTVMMVIGALFLLSAFANLALLRTSFNLLAFEMANVIFSIVAGLALLVLGAYGRVSGHLPADSPYAAPGSAGTADTEEPESFPSTPAEFAAEAAMREAELAVVQRRATWDQQRRVVAMGRVTSRQDRRRVWMSFDARTR